MPRPDGVGTEIVITSLDDADKVLHELAWLQQEMDKLEAWCRQKIEDLKNDLAAKAVVKIEADSEPVTMVDRQKALKEALEQWTVDNIRPLLPKGKKSKALAHGELGLRQKPLVVEIGRDDGADEAYKASAVLEWIDSSELTKKQKDALVEVETKLHLKGAKDALEKKIITREELATVGLVVRDEFDEPVVKPAKVIVSAEG